MNKRLLILCFLLSFNLIEAQSKKDSLSQLFISTFTHVASGDYSQWHEPQKRIESGLQVGGSYKQNSMVLNGGITYLNRNDINTVWPLYKPEYYPYLVFENALKTNVSDMVRLNAGLIYQMNDKTLSGFELIYTNSNTYNMEDPRFKTLGYTLRIKPKLMLKHQRFGIQLFPEYERANDELNLIVAGNDEYVFYQNLGLGLSQNPKIQNWFTGQVNSESYGLQTSVFYAAGASQIYTSYSVKKSSIQFDSSDETWNVLIPEAIYTSTQNILDAGAKVRVNKIKHAFSYNYTNISKSGAEYIRLQEYDGINSEFWTVYGKTDKYQYISHKHKFSYKLLVNRPKTMFKINTGLAFLTLTEKYYGIEQTYNFGYALLKPHGGFELNFAPNKLRYTLGMKYSRFMLSNQSYHVAEGLLATHIYQKTSDYLSGNPHTIKLNFKTGKEIKVAGKNCFAEINLKSNFILPENSNLNRQLFDISLELNF